jgi:hypothetical protein
MGYQLETTALIYKKLKRISYKVYYVNFRKSKIIIDNFF